MFNDCYKIFYSGENEYLDEIPEYKNNPIYSRFTPIDILFEYEESPIQIFNYFVNLQSFFNKQKCQAKK